MATYCQETKGSPNALIFYLPTFGDHSKDYSYLFEKFATNYGIRTYAMDRRGFGQS